MKNNQCASNYLVCFSGLAICCSWGKPALRYRSYEGLLPQIKDKLRKGKKPQTLQVLKQKVQHIDARYWEHAQECSCEQQYSQSQNPSKSSTSTASTAPTSTLEPIPRSDICLEQKPKLKNPKPSAPCVDLSHKPDPKDKLTQQE
jgi:hypothetical protein